VRTPWWHCNDYKKKECNIIQAFH